MGCRSCALRIEAALWREAEAAAPLQEPIEELSEESIAARLGDLGSLPMNGRSGRSVTTNVVVVGLVSVASIASFKRHLARLPGIQSVGVSSGPDGEFVFKATHDPDVSLGDAVPMLPGFAARVVAAGDGVLNISAPDREAGPAGGFDALLRERRDIGLAVIDGETDFNASLELYSNLHDDGRDVPTLMVLSQRAFERLNASQQADDTTEYFTRPYSAESLRWRV